jgi:NTP pyrophosphatase (non-canonical NTP hydrolase)
MTKQELYQKAIDTWGIYSQTLVFHEEMAEVFEIVDGFAEGNLTEEIADAIIMIEQMAHNYKTELNPNLNCLGVMSGAANSEIERLHRGYLYVCIYMSHVERKRAVLSLLETSLENLYGWLLLYAHLVAEISSEELNKVKEQKLHRLASMLGVEYQEGE